MGSEHERNERDTDRPGPPGSEDVYSAATVVKTASPELMEELSKNRRPPPRPDGGTKPKSASPVRVAVEPTASSSVASTGASALASAPVARSVAAASAPKSAEPIAPVLPDLSFEESQAPAAASAERVPPVERAPVDAEAMQEGPSSSLEWIAFLIGVAILAASIAALAK